MLRRRLGCWINSIARLRKLVDSWEDEIELLSFGVKRLED